MFTSDQVGRMVNIDAANLRISELPELLRRAQEKAGMLWYEADILRKSIEAQDAEIAQLRSELELARIDARHYRRLRDESCRIGDRIKKRRVELGMSLRDLAIATDSSLSYLCGIENRDDANPSINKLVRIAEALGVSPSFLLGEGELVAQEPVAWAWNDALGCMHVHCSPHRPVWVDRGSSDVIQAEMSLRPLYAAPTYNSRQPFTIDQKDQS